MTIFKMFSHLLFKSRAWALTVSRPLRQFFEGISNGLTSHDAFTGPREYVDQTHAELDPQQTTSIELHEEQFGLLAGALTLAERRDRVAAAWAANGGQSPSYIEATVRAAGFDVYLHEWWDPNTEAVRDPNAVLASEEYQLINKREAQVPDYITYGGGYYYGDSVSYYGGQNGTFLAKDLQPIPSDSDDWHYFVYFGAATWGVNANVPAERKDEFEALVLKLCPTHLFIGLLVTYV